MTLSTPPNRRKSFDTSQLPSRSPSTPDSRAETFRLYTSESLSEIDRGALDSTLDSTLEFSLSQAQVSEVSTTCSVCSAALGKRRLNPRHHCRVCGKAVCASCSPSNIVIRGSTKLQRACTPCISSIGMEAVLIRRVLRLAEELTGGYVIPALTMEAAIEICEASAVAFKTQTELQVSTAEQSLQEERRQRCELEARLERAAEQVWHASTQFQLMDGVAAPAQPARQSLEESIIFWNGAMAQMKAQMTAQTESRRLLEEHLECALEQLRELRDRSRSELTPQPYAALTSHLSLEQLHAFRGDAQFSYRGASSLREPHGVEYLLPSTASLIGSIRSNSSLWEHASKCNLCHIPLGKRRLRPRHHCRLCGKSVCNACSPSFIQLQGLPKPARTCRICVHRVLSRPDCSIQSAQ